MWSTISLIYTVLTFPTPHPHLESRRDLEKKRSTNSICARDFLVSSCSLVPLPSSQVCQMLARLGQLPVILIGSSPHPTTGSSTGLGAHARNHDGQSMLRRKRHSSSDVTCVPAATRANSAFEVGFNVTAFQDCTRCTGLAEKQMSCAHSSAHSCISLFEVH
jgi:hypothetical protein